MTHIKTQKSHRQQIISSPHRIQETQLVENILARARDSFVRRLSTFNFSSFLLRSSEKFPEVFDEKLIFFETCSRHFFFAKWFRKFSCQMIDLALHGLRKILKSRKLFGKFLLLAANSHRVVDV